MNEDKESEMINYLKMSPKKRTKGVNTKICLFLKTLKPLIDYLDEPTNEELYNILYKLSENITYLELPKGSILKKIEDEESNFYILLKGKVAELTIKYSKIFLTLKEYLQHIIKLQILQENFLLQDILKRNKNIYNISFNDPITHCKDLKTFKYEEYYHSLKKYIINNEWFKNYDINDFIKLINFKKKIKIAKTEKDINHEPEYCFNIPEYIFSKFITKGYNINTLTEPKHIKELYTYITIKRSKIAVLDKYQIDNLDYYKGIHIKQKDLLENIIKDLFIFQGIDINFIMNNYSSFFEYKLIKKGEIIIKQDTPHYGIFLIKNGTFNVITNKTINEIEGVIHCLKHSTDNFRDYISKFKSHINDNEKKNKNNNITNSVSSSSEFIKMSNQKKNFLISTVDKNDIIGLSDFYDFKTGNNLFNVECISDEAEIFFVPNTIVNSLLNSYDIINKKIALHVEQRANYYINNLIRQKNKFEKETGELIRQRISKTPNIRTRIFSGLNNSKNYKSVNLKLGLINKYRIKSAVNNSLLNSNKKIKDRMEQVSHNYLKINDNLETNNNYNLTVRNNNINTKILNITKYFNKNNNTFRLKTSTGKKFYNKIGNDTKKLLINRPIIIDNKKIISYSYSKKI